MDKSKQFTVSTVSREDVQDQLKLTDEQRDNLTDEFMQSLADKMGEFHTNEFYWQDLEMAYDKLKEILM